MNADTAGLLDSRDFRRIARAIAFIERHFLEQPRLTAIASHVGLSEFHFNRLFRRWAGLTPKQYLAHVTGRAAHGALAEEPSVLDAAHAVGLSGPGRLHDLVVTLDAMTPGELKSAGAGVRLTSGVAATPFGCALFATTERGLASLAFLEPGSEGAAQSALRARWPQARWQRDDAAAASLAQRLWSSREAGPLTLAVTGTNFQLKVWEALLALGARERTSYSALAAAIGRPTAARAVAQAVGANPIGWLIPCHRVLRASGELGGYRWGLDRKRAILAWERLRTGEGKPPISMLHRSAMAL